MGLKILGKNDIPDFYYKHYSTYSLHTYIFSPRVEAATSILSPRIAAVTSTLSPQISTGFSSGKEGGIDEKQNVGEDKKAEGMDSQKKTWLLNPQNV